MTRWKTMALWVATAAASWAGLAAKAEDRIQLAKNMTEPSAQKYKPVALMIDMAADSLGRQYGRPVEWVNDVKQSAMLKVLAIEKAHPGRITEAKGHVMWGTLLVREQDRRLLRQTRSVEALPIEDVAERVAATDLHAVDPDADRLKARLARLEPTRLARILTRAALLSNHPSNSARIFEAMLSEGCPDAVRRMHHLIEAATATGPDGRVTEAALAAREAALIGGTRAGAAVYAEPLGGSVGDYLARLALAEVRTGPEVVRAQVEPVSDPAKQISEIRANMEAMKVVFDIVDRIIERGPGRALPRVGR